MKDRLGDVRPWERARSLLPEPFRSYEGDPTPFWQAGLGALLALAGLLSAIWLLATQPVLSDWILDVRGKEAMAATKGSRGAWSAGKGSEEINIQLETPAGARRASVRTSSKKLAWAAKVGNPIPVVYDPEAPTRVRIRGERLARGSFRAGLGLVVAAVGVAVFVAGRTSARRGGPPAGRNAAGEGAAGTHGWLPGGLRRAVYRAHFLLACTLGGFIFLGASLAWLVFALLLPRRAHTAPRLFARSFSWPIRALLGWRLDVEGRERLEDVNGVIAVNHQSNLDIVVHGGIFPRRTVVIGKREVAKIPIFGWFFTRTGNILIDRKDPVSARETIAQAAAIVRERGLSVWMFPEGHRNSKDTLLPFKKGAFHMAIAAQVPVIVVVAEPLRGVLDAHRLLLRPGTIRIRVLPPIPTSGRGEDDVDRLLEETRALMQGTRDELAATGREEIR